MDEIKDIAKRIISDLMSNEPLTNVLLKAKIYAARKHDTQLQEWVERELNGYEENLPSYRILDAGVKVDIHRGFEIVNNFEYPIEMVADIKIRERLRHMPVHSSVSEIEEFSNSSESSTIQMEVPVAIWHNHMGHCISGNIQRAYQYVTIASLRKILVSVESLLIDYFLKIDNDETFNFAQMMKKEERDTIVDNRTIYTAAVINTGSGNIQASNVTNVVGDNNVVSLEVRNELQRIVDEVEKLLQPTMTDDCKELIDEIKEGISSESPKPKFLKRCFQALKGIASDVATTIVSSQVIELIDHVLVML